MAFGKLIGQALKTLARWTGIALNVLGKLATLVISIPATYAVAGVLTDFFGLTSGVAIVAMRVAAVIGVEYVLLRSWYKLATDKQASMEIKVKRTLTALAIYVAMLVIAILHGEGLAGWIFRLSLLLAMLDDMGDSLLWTWQKMTARAERDATQHWLVRLHSLSLDIKEQKAERSAMHDVRMSFLSAEKQGGLHAGDLYAERLKAENTATHDSKPVITHDTTHDIPRKWDQWVDPRSEAKDSAKTQVATILQAEPDISNYALAKRVGRSDATIRRYRKELETEGVLSSNGHNGDVR